MRQLMLTLGLALATGPGFASEVSERFEKTIAFPRGGSFHLENVNGSVRIETWDEPSVRIEAEKKAPDEARLREIEIEVTGDGDRVEVRTRYPRSRGEKGSVSYFIQLPDEARVEAQTVNGRLEVRGVEGGLRVSTVNGSLRVQNAAGDVEATTVNGSIEANLSALADGRYHFSTTNGSVTLGLPAGAGGDVEAKTVNGSITTDFPVTLSGNLSRKHLRARIGEGGASFEISTVNGSIRLQRS